MPHFYIHREAELKLYDLATRFPLVLVSGPKKSGKTTMVRYVFPDKAYISLEEIEPSILTEKDFAELLANCPQGAIFDNVGFPEFFAWLSRASWPRDRGFFIVTCSKKMDPGPILAPDLAHLELLPLCLSELDSAETANDNLGQFLCQGSFPEPITQNQDYWQWYENYLEDYLPKVIFSRRFIRELQYFKNFIKHLAQMTGKVLNISALSYGAGISASTAYEWLSILEDNFMVFRVPPSGLNFGKNPSKAPKLYFYDYGLLAHILELNRADDFSTHPFREAIFKNYVISEVVKAYANAGLKAPVYQYRDQNRFELDLIIDRGDKILLVDIKASPEIKPEFISRLNKWHKRTRTTGTIIVYGGLEFQVRGDVRALSWTKVYRALGQSKSGASAEKPDMEPHNGQTPLTNRPKIGQLRRP